MRAVWLGQAGIVLSAGGSGLVIDPWLSDDEVRRYPPPGPDALGDGVQWLLATHGHEDHLDVPALPRLVRMSPALGVIVPTPLVERVRAAVPSVDVRGLRPGDSVDLGALTVTATSACHAETVSDGYSTGPFVGYVIRDGGASVYHAGDTLVTGELIEEVRSHAVEVAILPINGRDYFRERAGIVGNMDAREAVHFAVTVGARILIPVHYDAVRGNTARAGTCGDIVAEESLPLHVLQPARLMPFELPLAHP